MNEQLVGWFEDLIPEIKKNGEVEDVFLKFASEKNLAPALLEKLGHVYNTAKTVNYLDKSASHNQDRGNSFEILNVPTMMEKYAEAKPGDDHEYETNDFASLSSGSFTALKPETKIKGVDFEALLNAPDYEEIKIASVRNKNLLSDSIKQANSGQIDQLRFELVEDIDKLASELIDEVRTSYNEITMEDLEHDARYYFGDSVKEACDHVVGRFKKLGYAFEPKEGDGPSRFVRKGIVKFAIIQDNLNTIEQASSVKKNFAGDPKTEKSLDLFGESSENKEAGTRTRSRSGESSSTSRTDAPRQRVSAPSGSKSIGESLSEIPGSVDELNMDPYFNLGVKKPYGIASGVASGAGSTLGMRGSIPAALRGAHEDLIRGPAMLLGEGKSKKQKEIDSELNDAKYEALIQELLITDPILSEEDEDKIIASFNTIKSVAPELAKDKNVMRVALRSAVQHDGITPFDLQQFIEAEKELQKVRHNIYLERDIAYTPEKRDRRMSS